MRNSRHKKRGCWVTRGLGTGVDVTINEPLPIPSRTLNPRSLWAGGVAAGVVAALVAVVGIVVCRGLLDVSVLAPKGSGTWGDASTIAYGAGAFVAGLLATALIHLLYSYTPNPSAFFGWIVGLLVVIAAVIPLVASVKSADGVATGHQRVHRDSRLLPCGRQRATVLGALRPRWVGLPA
jgi:hypothetical protein